jgi:hypothetical protein
MAASKAPSSAGIDGAALGAVQSDELEAADAMARLVEHSG